MKKILSILIIFFIFFCYLFISEVNASTEIQIQGELDKKTVKQGEEINLTLSIKDLINIGQGVNAYSLDINYIVNDFDFVKVEGKNNWNTPTYNKKLLEEGKLKLVATNPNFCKENNSFLKVTLKAKKDFNTNISKINVTNIKFAVKINGTTSKLSVPDFEVKVAEEDNKTEVNNQYKKENAKLTDKATKQLPKAGILPAIEITVILLIIIGGIFLYKYNIIDM